MKVIHDIRIDWQSTLQQWMAYRGDGEKIELCGIGKTPIEALAHLIEQEMEAEPIDLNGGKVYDQNLSPLPPADRQGQSEPSENEVLRPGLLRRRF